MKVPAAAVAQTAMKERGVGIEQGRFTVTIRFQLLPLAGERCEMGRLRRADDMTLRQVAVDPMRGDPLPDQRLAFLGDGKADLRLAAPEQPFELAHPCGIAGADLAAIAP